MGCGHDRAPDFGTRQLTAADAEYLRELVMEHEWWPTLESMLQRAGDDPEERAYARDYFIADRDNRMRGLYGDDYADRDDWTWQMTAADADYRRQLDMEHEWWPTLESMLQRAGDDPEERVRPRQLHRRPRQQDALALRERLRRPRRLDSAHVRR